MAETLVNFQLKQLCANANVSLSSYSRWMSHLTKGAASSVRSVKNQKNLHPFRVYIALIEISNLASLECRPIETQPFWQFASFSLSHSHPLRAVAYTEYTNINGEMNWIFYAGLRNQDAFIRFKFQHIAYLCVNAGTRQTSYFLAKIKKIYVYNWGDLIEWQVRLEVYDPKQWDVR